MPFAMSHSGQRRSVQVNGTPFRKPRKSGGSPSGVSRPPQLETMKMKRTTRWTRLRRDSLARRSGRIRSTDAPVVPITLARTAPIASSAVFMSGVPESEPST
jgi:hypothetical protein